MVFNHYVVIDGERYLVPDDGGIDAVRDEVLRAVHAGGAYVALGRTGVGYTEVLVTALTPIRIEHFAEEQDPQPADTDDDVAATDPGWWL